jgi:hypothetical protein
MLYVRESDPCRPCVEVLVAKEEKVGNLSVSYYVPITLMETEEDKKMKRVVLFLAAIMVALSISTPALAGEWVAFPATWAWCEYDYYGTYWCYLENDQMWIRVNPNWQSVPGGG